MSDDSGSGWEAPQNGMRTGLHIQNSITQSKTEFVPASGRRVLWYICGPTVYDYSHVGHARNYVSFDILRRVMADYFNYDIFYVMNITDIDDKIIIRTHQNRVQALVDAAAAFKDAGLIGSDVEAFDSAVAAAVEILKIKAPKLTDLHAAGEAVLERLQAVRAGADGRVGAVHLETVDAPFDIQLEYLRLAVRFEQAFFKDLSDLGCRPPTAVTRVSEYVQEVIDFVQKIIDNGYAYESDGNVYFDIAKFRGAGYEYFKTSANVDNKGELLEEGEGSLTDGKGVKRAREDFVLWKAAKPHEPVWASPWGEGRPGWHIECSAMASDLLGSNVDINCGGCDLRFPHHDNQLAQSEARFEVKQWVNYFLHTGHLHIDGLKMSKSLKNFITISQCLKNHTSRQLRILFLTRLWSSGLEISLAGGSVQINVARAVLSGDGVADADVTEAVRSFVDDRAPAVLEFPPKLDVVAELVNYSPKKKKKSKDQAAPSGDAAQGAAYTALSVFYSEFGQEKVATVPVVDGKLPDKAKIEVAREAGLLILRSVTLVSGDERRDVTADFRDRFTAGLAACELVLPRGTAVAAAEAGGRRRLLLHVRMNGEEMERHWNVADDGTLAEPLTLIAPGNISEMHEVLAIERTFSDFFLFVRALTRRVAALDLPPPYKWGEHERRLHEQFLESKDVVHAEFCNSINTPAVISALQRLVGHSNAYIQAKKGASFELLNTDLLSEIGAYVTQILKVMGVIPDSSDSFGFTYSRASTDAVVAPLADVLDRFTAARDRVRASARGKCSADEVRVVCEEALRGIEALPPQQHVASELRSECTAFLRRCLAAGGDHRALLELCDQVRDEAVPVYGVRFADDGLAPGQSEWHLDDERATLDDVHRARVDAARKERDRAALAEKKRLAALEREEKARKAAERARIAPAQLFREAEEYAGKYGSFDESGVPLTDADGAELGKKQRKKLEAALKKHVKEHEAQAAKDKDAKGQ